LGHPHEDRNQKGVLEEALRAELISLTNPDLALLVASLEARRSGRTVAIPTLTGAFASVAAAMSARMKPIKKLRRELEKYRRELDRVDSTIPWLEAQRVELNITSPEVIRRLAFLRERAKLLRLAIDEIEKLPEVTAP
jgi:septal ring factor EnvC (AmiA/AmiB activator)